MNSRRHTLIMLSYTASFETNACSLQVSLARDAIVKLWIIGDQVSKPLWDGSFYLPWQL